MHDQCCLMLAIQTHNTKTWCHQDFKYPSQYLEHLQFILTQKLHLTCFQWGFIEHRTGIVEVMGSNPIGASECFLGFICNCFTSQLQRSLSLLHLYLLKHSYHTCLGVFPSLSPIAANIYPLSSSSMCTVSLDRSSTSSNFVIPSGIHLLHKKEQNI